MNEVTIYTAAGCAYCVRAEQLLQRKGVQRLNKVRVDLDPAAMDRMVQLSGRRTVPQIFIGAYHVGGSDELHAMERQGRLDSQLARQP